MSTRPGWRLASGVLAALAMFGTTAAVAPSIANGDSSGAGVVTVPTDVYDDLADGKAAVIVQLAPGAGPVAAAYEVNPAVATQRAETLIAAIGPVDSEPEILPELAVVSLEVSAKQLNTIARSPLVSRIEHDVALFPALENAKHQIGASTAHNAGEGGGDTTIALIDSGVDSTHPAFGGRIVESLAACFTATSCPNGQSTQIGPGSAVPCSVARLGSTCGHGTSVAGIAVSSDVSRTGIAPQAKLIPIQVFSESSSPTECAGRQVPCPRARTSDVLAALEYVASLNQPNLVAVNLSLSSDSALAECDTSILAAAINQLRAKNIATIVASGNGSSTAGIGIPACVSSAISVGAVNASDQFWPNSNFGNSLDFLAPGVRITAPAVGGGYAPTTGTSAASPMVAGAWSVVAGALNTNNIEIIYSHLSATGVPVLHPTTGAFRPRIDLRQVSATATLFAQAAVSNNSLRQNPPPGDCTSQYLISNGSAYTVWKCTLPGGVSHWAVVRHHLNTLTINIWADGQANLFVRQMPGRPNQFSLYVCNPTSRSELNRTIAKSSRWWSNEIKDGNGRFLANMTTDRFYVAGGNSAPDMPGCVVQQMF